MPSPFPGMNPYLERRAVWHDFHESFIPAIRERIVANLGPEFVARIDDHIYIHELSAQERGLAGRANIVVSTPERIAHGSGTPR